MRVTCAVSVSGIQFAAAGQPAQFLIGHRGPEKVGKPHGDLVIGDGLNAVVLGLAFDSKQKIGREQDSFERELHAFLKWIAPIGGAIVKREKGLQFIGLNRSPKSERHKADQDLPRDLAWIQRCLTGFDAQQPLMGDELPGRGIRGLLVNPNADQNGFGIFGRANRD
jgi:hypothetical protein